MKEWAAWSVNLPTMTRISSARCSDNSLLIVALIVVCTITAAGADDPICDALKIRDDPPPCATLTNICQDLILARTMCPRKCGHCEVHEEWEDLTNSTTQKVTCVDEAVSNICEDFVKQHPDRCSSAAAQQLCAESCSHQRFECRDHIDYPYNCTDLANVCDHAQSAVFLCPKFCKLCNTSETAWLEKEQCFKCNDTVSDYHCSKPGACSSPLAGKYCPKTCFKCVVPTDPPTTAAATVATTAATTAATTVATTAATTVASTAVTTVATTVSTTAAATTTAAGTKAGSLCVTCGDDATGTPCTNIELLMGQTTRCDDATPYCMNDIIQTGNDVQQFRRCVGEVECNQLWYLETSDKTVCLKFDADVYKPSLACHLCCYGDNCNADDIPVDTTWYSP